MSTPRPTGIRSARDPRTPTLTVAVRGELDDTRGAEVIAAVVAELTGPAPPRVVRLDFRDLADIDPLGLAALLMVRRHAGAAGAVLHLDHRPHVLERLLRQTNVLGHLTGADAAVTEPEPSAGGG